MVSHGFLGGAGFRPSAVAKGHVANKSCGPLVILWKDAAGHASMLPKDASGFSGLALKALKSICVKRFGPNKSNWFQMMNQF